MITAPGLSIVMSTSFGRSRSVCIRTIVASALQTTFPSDPWTTAGTWNVCLPSKAEYIGLNATVRPPFVHWAMGIGVEASAAAGCDDDEHAAIATLATPRVTVNPTAKRDFRTITAAPSVIDVLSWRRTLSHLQQCVEAARSDHNDYAATRNFAALRRSCPTRATTRAAPRAAGEALTPGAQSPTRPSVLRYGGTL